ncbi:hypothetical protein [Microbulbifer sp. TRSA005]|uniref:hypothetical protein n=1 Tax=Microbulbifer sp. TRSA005 TaxID=3243383 RepID=UPI00403A1FC3
MHLVNKFKSIKKACTFVTLLLLFNLHIEAWASTDKTIKNIYNQIRQIYKNSRIDKNKINSAKQFYVDNVTPIINSNEFISFSRIELEYLFQATKITIAYNPEIKYVDDMNEVLNYLKVKNIIKKRHLADLQEAYIATRQFELARDMIKNKNLDYLQAIPKVYRNKEIASNRPTVWQIGKTSLTQRAFSIPNDGPFVLVVSNPLCNFSISAAKYIVSDRELEMIFSDYSYWLTEPRGKLYIESFLKWSLNYPKLPAGLMHIAPPWPGHPELRSNIGTPAFYFFSDGKLTESFVGWPQKGEPTALNNALANINLNRSLKMAPENTIDRK